MGELPPRIPDSEYPAGKPWKEDEHKASRNHRQKSLTDGRYICWDFSSHSGCRFPEESCPHGENEIIETKGLRLVIQMQLARRGRHLAGKKIIPKNVDVHVQALRLQLIAKDLDIPQPKWRKKKKDKAGG